MNIGKTTAIILLSVMTVSMVLVSGCFDTGTARRVFFPKQEHIIEYERGVIGFVRYNFTGPIYEENISLGAIEFHRSQDNFHIGKGGGEIYIWAQVHFIPDTQPALEIERYIIVSLVYHPDSGDPIVLAKEWYNASGSGDHFAEIMRTFTGAEPGLYSLKAEGYGTATEDGGAPSYDWFIVSVAGRYSDESYNNNAPT